ncbi:MAG TPA: sulfatase [Gemmataceae bacterium]|jgi:arylsulfatase A-like enzyme|nr:sulfatase [Gemmataceae bacterium]
MRFALLALVFCGCVTAAERKPNVVLFLTDDQRADCLGVSGHPLLKTPAIDRLAADGTRFRNAFVTTSICCISRASYFTGRLCRTHGVGDFQTPLPAPVLADSFPVLLRKAGYRTACYGKWGIGGPPPKDQFDAWDAWGDQGTYFLNLDGKRVHNSEYLTRRAIDFINSGPADQPFCLIVLYKSPHDVQQPDPRDAGLFKDATVVPPKTATDDHFDRLPEFMRVSMNRSRAVRDWPTPTAYQEYVKNYLRCIASVDRSVGEIMQAIAACKVADDTMTVFASDNGYFLGERGLIHKWLMYEESIRVPLIVHYPRLKKKGQTPEAMALNIDVAPTLLDYAGVAVPAGTDGRSLRPLLEARADGWRAHWFYEHHYHARGSKEGAIPRTEGVRTADWKYITYIDEKQPFEELYDLKADPFEEKNRATDPTSAGKFKEMKGLYEEYVKKLPPAVLPRPAKVKK